MEQLKSLDSIIDSESRVIILGTMPGSESLSKMQYYANAKNPFWDIVFAVFDSEPLATYEDKVKFLKNKGIALWDVLDTCSRKGSLDSEIKSEKANDFNGLFSRYNNLRLVVFNGTKARELYDKHVRLYPGNIIFRQMPSTSPTPGKYVKSLDEKIADWKVIREYVGND